MLEVRVFAGDAVTKTSLIPPLTSARLHSVATLFLSGTGFFITLYFASQKKGFPCGAPVRAHTPTHAQMHIHAHYSDLVSFSPTASFWSVCLIGNMQLGPEK